jgi:hypothetical protein
MVSRTRAALAAIAVALSLSGAACDDNSANPDKIDEDDTNFGPGDGNDEVGPGR